jgi:uncharacterized RDD family membrane protein YckC
VPQPWAGERPFNIAAVRYAGFGPRFLAGMVDLLVCLVPYCLPLLTLSLGVPITLTCRLLATLFNYAYYIATTAIWGQTLGKRAARIRVQGSDGSAVTLGQSVMRVAVTLVYALVLLFASMVTYASLSPDVLAQAPAAVRAAMQAQRPGWVLAVDWLSIGFGLADILVFFASSKHRALHDLMAGTVVVHTD